MGDFDHRSYCQKLLPGENLNDEDNSNGSDNDYTSENDFDAELIKKIKNHPCLYNPKFSKNKDFIQTAWNLVAIDLNATVSNCQTRWKRLRQYFSKERLRQESGSQDHNKFPLYEEMSFMNPFIIRKKNFKRQKKITSTADPNVASQSNNNSLINAEISKHYQIQEPIEMEIIDVSNGGLDNNTNNTLDEVKNVINLDNNAFDNIGNIVLDNNNTCNEAATTELSSFCERINSERQEQNGSRSSSVENISFSDTNEEDAIPRISSETRSKSLDKSKNCKEADLTNKLNYPFADLTSLLNASSELKSIKENKKISNKDEENEVIAELVVKRLKKIEGVKKNAFIQQIMNILYQ